MEQKIKTMRQLEPGKDLYELSDGQKVTLAQFERLKALMPETKFIAVVWDFGLLPAKTRLNFDDAK
jgi:hypothetical protein